MRSGVDFGPVAVSLWCRLLSRASRPVCLIFGSVALLMLFFASWPVVPQIDIHLSLASAVPAIFAGLITIAECLIHRTPPQRDRWSTLMWSVTGCVGFFSGMFLRPLLLEAVYRPQVLAVAEVVRAADRGGQGRSSEVATRGLLGACGSIAVVADGATWSVSLRCEGIGFPSGSFSCEPTSVYPKPWLTPTYRDENLVCGWSGAD